TIEEVTKAIHKLKCDKSCGPDQLWGEIFIEGCVILAPVLCSFFNIIFDTGCYPTEWSDIIIVPVPKKGNLNDTDNYRGISVMNIIAKLFSTILNFRLMKWSESNYKFDESQKVLLCIY
ncbi:hypothetical protein LOTGIDRAFT_120765, partial [Lottia gigantea]